ncbi:hypothetical protein SBRCBS47491_005929 [Sporothrix bragantina]|uniref:F-box domain-containing protein n=1 Tax=Sporothrix bragantina TaxID=671064 RepID=A0ABP0C167_9PEZI
MALPATPGPRKICRRNPQPTSPTQSKSKPTITVKPSVSLSSRTTTPASISTSTSTSARIYRPMTIRVVTSDDEQSSECDDSSSDILDLDLDLDQDSDDTSSFTESLGDSDDDVFMPILRAATAMPMKTQRAQARTTTTVSTRKKDTTKSTTADTFPPALVAFLQDDTDLAQFAKLSTGPRDTKSNNNIHNAANAIFNGVPAVAPPRYENGGGPPSVPSPPARLPGTTTSQNNMAASSMAGLLQNVPSSQSSRSNMNAAMSASTSTMARHELVESYVPAPLRVEKKPSTGAATASSSPVVQQSTEDFVRRTDRSMARQQAQVQAMQQQQQQQPQQQPQQQQPQQITYTPQQLQNQYALQQRRPSVTSQASAPPAAPITMARERSASWSSQAPPASTYTAHMSQMNMGYRPHHPTNGTRPGAPFQWQRPAPIKPAKTLRRRAPGEMFAALPGEVLELILDELKKLHLEDSKTKSCATCWMRDAGAMAVTARKMLKYARVALYESIEIAGTDNHQTATIPKKKYKTQADKDQATQTLLLSSSRLALLQRTLRESPAIAAIVRTLRVPPAFASPLLTSPTHALADEYETLVSSVVMACPNLERVVGYYPTYDHAAHGRLAQALSTRMRLKEAHWVVAPLLSPEQKEQQAREQREKEALLTLQAQRGRGRSKSFSHMKRAASPPSLPSPPVSPKLDQDGNPFALAASSPSTRRQPTALNPRQSARFLNHHIHWQYLSTLTVHCQPGATLTPATLLVDALMYLPALQNLYLSHLPAGAFNDQTLLALPPLKKLSLVHLPGVTADGLSTYATRATSRSLVSLRLEHVALDALPALARLLSKLDRLASLTVVQPQAPALTPGEVIWLFPYLASPSLEALHWDVPMPAAAGQSSSSSMTGDVVLARSIEAGGFPRLRQLRTPVDPEGMFQALCRPQERVDLPRDRYRSLGTHYPAAFSSQGAAQQGSPSSPPSASHRHRHSESSSSIFSSSLGSHSRSNSSASFTFSSKASSPSSTSSASSSSSTSAVSSSEWSCTNLQQARTSAQARIDASRRQPRMLVNVIDEHDRLVDKYGLAGFLGTVGSPINYHLVPDAGASDEKGGLVDMADFLGTDKKETKDLSDDVCIGQWKANWEVPQKKDRERWWHAERSRSRTVKLI